MSLQAFLHAAKPAGFQQATLVKIKSSMLTCGFYQQWRKQFFENDMKAKQWNVWSSYCRYEEMKHMFNFNMLNRIWKLRKSVVFCTLMIMNLDSSIIVIQNTVISWSFKKKAMHLNDSHRFAYHYILHFKLDQNRTSDLVL